MVSSYIFPRIKTVQLLYHVDYLLITCHVGDYGEPPTVCNFIPQLVVWLVIVLISKIFTLLVLGEFISPINSFTKYFFMIFADIPNVELIVVMVIGKSLVYCLLYTVYYILIY